MRPVLSLSVVLLIVSTLGCGGATSDGSSQGSLGSAGAGGDGAGGSGSVSGSSAGGGAVGGSTGGGSSGGATTGSGGVAQGGVAGGGQVCCLAAAVCGPGEKQIDGPDACPVGGDCYSNTVCCDTIWCLRETAQCNAYPACDASDEEVTVCPTNGACYERSLCGSTILCASAVDGGAGCDPATEYNRSYAGLGDQCQVIDFMCIANTMPFSNACGCGCEQDPTCPEWVNCMPGPTPNPQCGQDFLAACPYTQVAY